MENQHQHEEGREAPLPKLGGLEAAELVQLAETAGRAFQAAQNGISSEKPLASRIVEGVERGAAVTFKVALAASAAAFAVAFWRGALAPRQPSPAPSPAPSPLPAPEADKVGVLEMADRSRKVEWSAVSLAPKYIFPPPANWRRIL